MTTHDDYKIVQEIFASVGTQFQTPCFDGTDESIFAKSQKYDDL